MEKLMPIDENELDKIVDPSTQDILSKMEKGKWYSIGEISEMLLGKDIYKKGIEYVKKPERDREEEWVDFLTAVGLFFIDTSSVESFLITQGILGNITKGFKDDIRYYARKC